MRELDRLGIATLPTPVEVAGVLPTGRRLLIKRDDLTGLGIGGNKARKLDYLCAEAVAAGSDMLVTVGAAQSNHARVTAAAGARLGIETHLFLGGSASTPTGNQLLAVLFGAHLHFCGTDRWDSLRDQMHSFVEQAIAEGRRPFSIPIGGSTPTGAAALAFAQKELVAQLRDISVASAVVFASSTGGTHAGLIVGRALFGGPRPVAIAVAKETDLRRQTLELAGRTAELLAPGTTVDKGDLNLYEEYTGPGYAVPTPEADAAMIGLARSGGWVLDRVYTAKAFAGLVDLDRRDLLGEGDVVFWHTGGVPALFAAGGAPAVERAPSRRVITTESEGLCSSTSRV